MEKKNQSHPAEFFLRGILAYSSTGILMFIFFTSIYITSLLVNVIIILTTALSSTLQTPMYFFLSNLSIFDICCISSTVPKMLYNFVMTIFTISFYECVTQLYIFTWVAISELLLLTFMAFDRYVAICKPLHYSVIITRKICFLSSLCIWCAGAFSSVIHTSMTFSLSFCNSLEINHFFCEIPPLLKLSCTGTALNEMLTLITDLFLCIVCFLFVCVSYSFIISNISHIRSVEGKRKASSACTSHILVVCIYYGTMFFAYINPHSDLFVGQHKILSVVYTIFIPLLNPLIYTVRNRDLAEALAKVGNKMHLKP